jgi:hypothetical protein
VALTVWETVGREFSFGEGRTEDSVQYFVTEGYDEPTVLAALEATVPGTFNGLWFLRTSAREVGYGYWEGTAHYGIPAGGSAMSGQGGVSPPPPPPPPPAATDELGPEWSFDTTGGTQHIVVSKETREAINWGGFGTAPDTKRVIGVSKTGEPAGCDVVVPKFEFQIVRRMEFMTLNYLRDLVDLTGKVNDATFMTVFSAGEVLFLGASGAYRDGEGWSVTFRFSAAPNKTGDGVAVNPVDRVSPFGHDFVWASYEDEVSNDHKVSVPVAAYVERVYDEGDFDDLAL